MKILTPISSYEDPAARFRLLQYKEPLEKGGAHLLPVMPIPPKESDPSWKVLRNKYFWKQLQLRARKNMIRTVEYDAIWQNRLLLYNNCRLEAGYGKPFVFDIDDSIWLTEGRDQVIKVIAKANAVFAGNDFIAEFCRTYNSNTMVIPTVVDTYYYHPLVSKDRPFTIGWIGTKSNFRYLEKVLPVIKEFLKDRNARFLLVSSEPPGTIHLDERKFQFLKWNENAENDMLNQFDVGIMPLQDDEWTRGKCGLKLLQYMACGKPFIASPVGINPSLLKRSGAGWAADSPAQWMEALSQCYNDAEQRKAMGEAGRRFVQEYYSIDKWAPRVLEEFNKIITKG